MLTSTKRIALSLLLSAPALAIAPSLAGHVSAAPAAHPISMAASLSGRTVQLDGTNFVPGSRVGIAVINTRTWAVLHRDSTHAEAATYLCPKGTSIMCGQADPAAGKVHFSVTLRLRARSALGVLYRSTGAIGFAEVRRQ